jgi:predicted Zn finger-like uncharacterized protein
MIIQCDQCNTKFRLDDTKVPDKGIKVRCAKCKHVFMVHKDSTPEEMDLDFLLSGLGAPAPSAEKGLPPGGEAPISSTSGEEWQMFAQVPDSAGEGPGEPPAVDGKEQAQGSEFDEDFFADKKESVALEKKGLDLGEFSFENEESQSLYEADAKPEAAGGMAGVAEFGEFPFEEGKKTESGATVDQPSFLGEPAELAFEPTDFATAESAEINPDKDFGGGAEGKIKEGEYIFSDEQGEQQAEDQAMESKPGSLTKGEEAFDFSEFAVLPGVLKDVENPPIEALEEKKEAEPKTSDFGEIDFGDTSAFEPTVTQETEKRPDLNLPKEPVVETVSPPSFVSSKPSTEEDLPPIAIATRKKRGSFFSIAVTTIAVLIVLTIACVGFYVLKEGPSAFNQLGLSFLAKWAGMEVAEEGGIAIKNPKGAFLVNKEAGEIFVVSGEAVNNFKKPRASIQVKATVLGPKGEILAQKTAYCGNFLSNEQLVTLPMAKIEEAMGSPFGDSLANLGVQPGKSIPFVIVFNGVQKNASEFSAEVVGSTVAGQ